jgi:hypothetical protein
MQHTVDRYSESDLMVALASPFNSPARQEELDAEYIRRLYDIHTEVEQLQPLTT